MPSQSEQARHKLRRSEKPTEQSIVAYARRAMRLAGSRDLAACGGVFLNINSNSSIISESGCERFYVPSAPHDAGISHGCALIGTLRGRSHGEIRSEHYQDDRIGPTRLSDDIGDALSPFDGLIVVEPYEADKVVELLVGGALIARSVGRSEFGPRALGGRSLLASPTDAKVKDRLNAVKGRQSWRPVAPIATAEEAATYFDGPMPSPFMNLLQQVREEWRDQLPALRHPDHSTRLQTLDRDVDPALHALITSFGIRTGAHVLVNTSMNGPGQPIVETPEEAIRFLLTHPKVELLILDRWIVRRQEPWADTRTLTMKIAFPTGSTLILARSATGVQARVTGREGSHTLGSKELIVYLTTMGHADPCGEVVERLGGAESSASIELYELVCAGLISLSR